MEKSVSALLAFHIASTTRLRRFARDDTETGSRETDYGPQDEKIQINRSDVTQPQHPGPRPQTD